MEIEYSTKFARQYKKLPKEIKDKAEKIEVIFRNNPFDKKLRTHKLSGNLKDFYAFSITGTHRIIFDNPKSGLYRFYSVGDHSIYE
jgi:addiction module RelE/StbE family toxin